MGRWGEPPAKAARERSIAVRMKKPPKTFLTTPENVGKENNLYPPWVEKLWNLYEGDLIRVAGIGIPMPTNGTTGSRATRG